MESGVLAATAIIHKKDYQKLVQPIVDDVKKLHELRRVVSTFDNDEYDKLIQTIGQTGIKQFLYNNPFMRIQYGAVFAKIFNRQNDNL